MTGRNKNYLTTGAVIVGIIGGLAALIWGRDDRVMKQENRISTLENSCQNTRNDIAEIKEILKIIQAYMVEGNRK